MTEPLQDKPSAHAAEQKIRFRCSGCGKGYAVPAQHAGRSTECPECGQRLVVPRPEPEASAPPEPELIGISCGLCGTRMDVPAVHIGKKVKCPDCHSLTLIEAPKAKPPKTRPAALDGEQYEIYEGDDQPTGEELRAQQEKLIPVVCRLCETLMHAREDQLGQRIACPDCGAETRVVEKVEQEERVWTEAEGEDLEVEAPVETPRTEYVAAHTGNTPLGYREALDDKARAAKVARKPPSDAMVRGVMDFWASPGAVVSVLGIACGFMIAVGILVAGLVVLSGGIGLYAIPFGLFLLSLSGFAFIGWFGLTSAIYMTVLNASLDGNAKVPEWPGGDFRDWFASIPRILLAFSAAVAPGALFASFVAPEYWVLFAWGSVWLLLPWTILSQLEADSVWVLFSPRLAMTLAWAPGSWAVYYTLALALFGGTAALELQLIAMIGWWALLITPLVDAFALMTSARLLGRLAWVFTDCMPEARAAEAG